MKKVILIKQTCFACPEQYEGFLDTGEQFYIRCRWGSARLDVGTEKDVQLPTVSTLDWPSDPFKGGFDEGEIQMLFKQANIEIDNNLLKQAQDELINSL